MDTAIAGLIGVAVGGVVTGGVQAVSAWTDRRLTARSSARLIYMQLHGAEAAVEELAERRSWGEMITDWETYGRAWSQHAVPLARALKTNECLHLASAFGCLESLANSRAKDERDVLEQDIAGDLFNPSPEILDMYVKQLKAAKYLALKGSYTWLERRRGEDRRAIASLEKEIRGE